MAKRIKNKAMDNQNSIEEKVTYLRSIMRQLIRQQFQDAIAELEKKEPNWFASTVCSLVLGSLRSLKQCIDPDTENSNASVKEQYPKRTWHNPELTLAFGVPWDWERNEIAAHGGVGLYKQIENDVVKLDTTEQKEILVH